MVAWYHGYQVPLSFQHYHFQPGQLSELPLPSMVQIDRTSFTSWLPVTQPSAPRHPNTPRPRLHHTHSALAAAKRAASSASSFVPFLASS